MPIDPRIFELIRSSDVEERKKGVKALARSENREALRYLASLYNQDPDPEVRDLALKAGQHIKKRGELAEWGSDQGKHAGKFEDVEIKRDSPKQRNKLPDNPKINQAKALMDKAMDKMMMSEYAEAQDLAYEAFAIAPNLDTESYYATLAGDIMGLPQAQAIAALKAGREDYDVNGKPKRKRGASGGGEASWTDFLIDTAILYIVSTGTMLFMMFFLFSQIQGLAASGVFDSSYSADPTMEVLKTIPTEGTAAAIFFSLGFGLGTVLMNLFQFVVLHFCAGMLGGNGSFRMLVHKSVIPLVLSSIISVVITGATYYFTFQAIVEAGGDPNALMYNRQAVNTLNSLYALSLLVGVAYLLWLSFIIGRNYDFGFGKGCGTIIVSIIALGILGCGCIFILSSVITSMLY